MFQIDAMSRTPVYEQLIGQMEKFILSGVLKPGEQIPSVRRLSLELTVNPNTILKAYGDLDARGLIRSVPGRGYFVCENAYEVLRTRQTEHLKELRMELVGMALAGIERETVLRCVDDAYERAEKIRRRETEENDCD